MKSFISFNWRTSFALIAIATMSLAHANDGGILVYKAKEITVEKKDGKFDSDDATKIKYAQAISDDAPAAIKSFYRAAGKEKEVTNEKVLLVRFKTKKADGHLETQAKLDLRQTDADRDDDTKVLDLVFDSITCTNDSIEGKSVLGDCKLKGAEAGRLFKALPAEPSALANASRHRHGIATVSGVRRAIVEGDIAMQVAQKSMVFSCKDAEFITRGIAGGTWQPITPECVVSYEAYQKDKQGKDTGFIPLENFGDWEWYDPSHAAGPQR
jgi:hypothetical protein